MEIECWVSAILISQHDQSAFQMSFDRQFTIAHCGVPENSYNHGLVHAGVGDGCDVAAWRDQKVYLPHTL